MRHRPTLFVATLFVASLALLTVHGPTIAQTTQAQVPDEAVTVFRSARLILGDGSAPIEDAAFVVQGNRFVDVGPNAEVETPAGAATVDLSAKTVMPTLVDAHSHIGYMKDLTNGPENYTRENILDHMYRFAYHGVAASQAQGSDFGVMPFQLRDEILAGNYSDAARFLTAGRGLTPPDDITSNNMRHAAYIVTTEEGARANVQELSAYNVDLLKMWFTNRNGTVRQFEPGIVEAIIDEAHQHGIRVITHATEIENAKAALRAGVDAFAHMITDVDDELLSLFIERPQVAVLLAQVGRRMIHAPYLDLDDLGTVTSGKSADFIVLNANPLDDITNTREIDRVYLRGREVNRARLRAMWSGDTAL